MEPLLIPVSKAAQLCSISRSMAYQYATNGEWVVCRFGRSLRVDLAALIAWIDRNKTTKISA